MTDYNHKERAIVGIDIKCYLCDSVFKDGEIAYFADVSKVTLCKKCMGLDLGLLNNVNNYFLYGAIKLQGAKK